MMKVIFMGTPIFASVVLEGLINSKQYQIVGVVSQPDKMIGRKRILTPTPVKEVALKFNLTIFQPLKLSADYKFIEELKPDMIITCAYGQLLPSKVLKIPSLGCVNVHASLLPKLRGGAPIHRAILNNEQETGITIMEMAQKMDAGDIYTQVSTSIDINETLGSLSERLSRIGTDLLLKTLPLIVNKEIKRKPQVENEVTFGYNIQPSEERIDWNNSALVIHNQVRAFNPAPGAYTTLDGINLKIWETEIYLPSDTSSNYVNGEVLVNKKMQQLVVVCANNTFLLIKSLQFAGKKVVTASNFINGYNNHRQIILK